MTRARRQRVARGPAPTPARPLWQRLAAGYMRRPKLVRILVAALFGVAVTLLVSPQVDSVYLAYLFDVNTRVVPSLVSTAAGVVMYVVGWRLTLSVEAVEQPPLRAIAWYLLVGAAVVLIVAGLLIYGWIFGNLPT